MVDELLHILAGEALHPEEQMDDIIASAGTVESKDIHRHCSTDHANSS